MGVPVNFYQSIQKLRKVEMEVRSVEAARLFRESCRKKWETHCFATRRRGKKLMVMRAQFSMAGDTNHA